MKNFLRHIFINFFCLFLIAKAIGAISFSENSLILISAAICLTLFNLLIKPVLNLLLLPINMLTLGAFRWVTNVLVLYLVTLFVGGFKILMFTFPGLSTAGFVIPAIHFSFFWSLVLVSFLIEIIESVLGWIFK
ncbi:hypothetical protein COT03_00515 [Candidatus Shapirobacteria bacterium CG07_land_8_20_14_0_80_39_18]|uniref:Phage holin family protein n=1 Tax=Candidatus Shapirobacteria bacterium CG07_land_8_20_14_0_80_39_18 TaxID=1974882 RepID=A0A2M6YS54_9BACT|nr:phage holin family protein [Candidatus Microgenomates bacterium]PIU36228.1 MAG: hypothetical protein COT03_00515 [Candidatus Shapirobacteria bacterium CG07_land_8_20_14_0_80_39_18]